MSGIESVISSEITGMSSRGPCIVPESAIPEGETYVPELPISHIFPQKIAGALSMSQRQPTVESSIPGPGEDYALVGDSSSVPAREVI